MSDHRTWDDAVPAMPPQEPASGLTAEVMTRLESGTPLEPRARVTNSATYVLGGVALLVATFSVGAWVGRENAPSAASASSAPAAAAAFPAGGATGVTGASGRAGRPSGAAGAFPGASGASGAPGAAGAGLPGAGAGAGGTIGTVKLIDGANVYISTTAGTVVKVTTTPQSQINVTKQGSVADLLVGESVVVQGDAAADGTIAATSIRSGTAAGGFGGARGGAPGADPTASGATGR